VKRGGPLQHLKSYEVDGAVLRTGSANFSSSGENAPDNDLIVIRDPAAAARFEAHFGRMHVGLWLRSLGLGQYEATFRDTTLTKRCWRS
jgi:phosphatidylserine/phosphatidylglycerophosphate/cardiolipin synthase-like enzyme